MIISGLRTNVQQLVREYRVRTDDARTAIRRGIRNARPQTDAILNQETRSAFNVRDARMQRSWRLAVPSSGEVKLIIVNLMRGFRLHVTGGVISPKGGSKLLIPINTRFGTRIGTKKFYKMIDWLRREKLTVIKGNLLYVRVPMNESRRGGVAAGTRVQKRFRTSFQGSKRRPSGFDIKLNPEGLTPIAVLRPAVTLRARFDMQRIATTKIIPVLLDSIRTELASLK